MDIGTLIVYFICGTCILAAIIWSIIWPLQKSGNLIENWAAENGFDLLSREYRILRRGPFFFTTSKNQTVYYVTLRDREGNIRHAWIRCGNWWLGLFSDSIQVAWDTRANISDE